jgi:23S rRNA (guanosine2251-2'-O)-methyltransferase
MKKTYWIYGIHAVTAALQNPRRQCHRLCVLHNPDSYQHYKHVKVEQVDHRFFKNLFGDQAVHQGIALEVESLPAVDLYEFLATLKGESPILLVMLDQITDPHNVGAILRSAAAFGVKALIVTEHSTPSLTSPVLSKAASGAADHVPIIEIVNLSHTIEILKKADFWIIGLDEAGQKTIDQEDLNGRYVIVIGAEGKGLRRLVAESCDLLLKLPTSADFTTLNASNAAAIAFYEFFRQNSTQPLKK